MDWKVTYSTWLFDVDNSIFIAIFDVWSSSLSKMSLTLLPLILDNPSMNIVHYEVVFGSSNVVFAMNSCGVCDLRNVHGL